MLLQRNKKKQYIKVGELRMSENAEINTNRETIIEYDKTNLWKVQCTYNVSAKILENAQLLIS